MYTIAYYGQDALTQAEYDALYGAAASVPEGFYIWVAIASILAIIGGILLYFLFVRNKNTPKGKFASWLKDFLSFKIMWLEPILKVVYYILTIGCILVSFGFLGYGGAGILTFFVTLIGGPIIIRLGYEMTMMFIMIWRNTRDIAENTNTKKK